MNLSSILTPQAELPRVPARDKKQALKMLAAVAAEITGLPEREVYSVLMAREHLGCTGMGNGVCIPHGRFDDLTGIHAIIATLDQSIDFGAADGRPVNIICLLLTPSSANTEHLKALATLSRLMRDKKLVEELREVSDAASMYALLTAPRSEDA